MAYGGVEQIGASDKGDKMTSEDKTKWKALYEAVNEMMSILGADGEINTQYECVDDVMSALTVIDNGIYNPDLIIGE